MSNVPSVGKNLRREPFTMISNNFINDPSISLEAKSVLMIFLSNKESWTIDMTEIVSRSTNGRDKHYKCISELIEKGYMARVDFKRSGRFEKREYLYSDNKDEVVEGLKKYEDLEGVVITRSETEKVSASDPDHKQISEVKEDSKVEDTDDFLVEKEEEPKEEVAETLENTDFLPLPENPYTVEPYTEKPYTESQDSNNNNINNNNINNTNNLSKDLNKLSNKKSEVLERATKITIYFIEQLKSKGNPLPTEKIPDKSNDELLFYTWTAPILQLLNHNFSQREIMRAIDFALTDYWWVARVRTPQQLKDNFEQLYHKATAAINQSGVRTDPEFEKYAKDPSFVTISIDKQSLVDTSIFANSPELEKQGLFAFRMPGTHGKNEQAVVVPKERAFVVRKGNKIKYVVFLEVNSPVQILDYFGNPLPLEKSPTGYDMKIETFNDTQGAILPFTGS